jgi:hypothetical protein
MLSAILIVTAPMKRDSITNAEMTTKETKYITDNTGIACGVEQYWNQTSAPASSRT